MKFTITSAAALIASATAIPLYSNGTATASSSTATTLATSYIPASTSEPSYYNSRLQPEVISRYHSINGAVEFNVNGGVIQRVQGSGDDISTLATFYIPSSAYGKQCSFGFDVDYTVNFEPNPSQFDVFTSIKPAWADSATWPSGNLRDQQVGRMKLSAKPGAATFVDGQPTAAKTFPCPAGNYIAGELVPVGDKVDICFTPSSTAGPYISIHY
jgi:hypothetical protein